MRGVRQSIGIGKIGIRAADFPGLFVHPCSKSLHRAIDVFGDGHRRPVVRDHHHAQEKVLGIHLISRLQPQSGILRHRRIRGNRDQCPDAHILQAENAGHHLRHAGRRAHLIRILFIYHTPCRCLYENRRGRCNGRNLALPCGRLCQRRIVQKYNQHPYYGQNPIS